MQNKTFIFFGIAGSGKGTQIELLSSFLKHKHKDKSDIVYAYPGNEYRKLIENKNYTGNIIKSSMAKGELQPNFLTNAIVTNILTKELDDEKHLIIDGYPRTIIQSENLEQMMKFYNRKNIKMIYIKVGEGEAIKRNILRGRSDDTKKGIKKRFDEYKNNVIPAMEFFKNKKQYKLHIINGEQSIENVHKDIIKALKF